MLEIDAESETRNRRGEVLTDGTFLKRLKDFFGSTFSPVRRFELK